MLWTGLAPRHARPQLVCLRRLGVVKMVRVVGRMHANNRLLRWALQITVSQSVVRGEAQMSGEDVVEGDGLQVTACDDVDELGVAVRDGRQIGVAQHDLLRLKRTAGVRDQGGFVNRA
jgi:hypothetical protein